MHYSFFATFFSHLDALTLLITQSPAWKECYVDMLSESFHLGRVEKKNLNSTPNAGFRCTV